jgi:ABC-type multidrug transport system ATPase subunit
VREIVEDLAGQGAAVLWATQRIDEIRGFAHQVTLLGDAQVRFAGSVPALMARAEARDFVLRLGMPHGPGAADALAAALGPTGDVAPLDGEHWRLSLGEHAVLGEAIAALTDSGVSVLACHRERSELEEAFMALSGGGVA